ncbi:competence protein ComGB [Heyndrickxia sporothermodurans]|nr:competence protein ComGB [Heyndrickxia sporothermodurans]
MLENGFTLAEAIDFLEQFETKTILKSNEMLSELQNGIPIYVVLDSRGFDKKACTQLYFADKHGNLSSVLKEAGRYLLKKDNDRKTFVKLLQYPLLLIFLLIVVLILLKNYLLPQFELLYSSMNYNPTLVVSFFISFMKNAQFYILYSLGFFIFLVASSNYVLRKYTPIRKAKLVTKIPFIRFYLRLITSQFLAREWSFLLQGGFSINQILDMMRTQNFRPLIRDMGEMIHKDLTIGETFSTALGKFSFLDQQFITIVMHGEKSGRLEHELLFYSQFCLSRIEGSIQKVFRILQPIMFIIIGGLVVAVYLSILLPMFEMIDSI